MSYMKKVMIAFIAVFSVIAVGLVILMIYTISQGSSFIVVGDNEKLVNTQTISIEDIDSINIAYYYDDVTFYTSKTNEVVIKEYKSFKPKKNELTKISHNGSELSIKGKKRNIGFFGNVSGSVNVYIPEQYAGELKVSTTSGTISSDLVLKLSQFNASCSSGDVEMNEVYSEEIKVSTSSGNITLQTAEGNRYFSSTSGDIDVYNGNGDSNFSASSGYITVRKASGQLSATTTSGDIDIIDSTGDKDIDASSGQITIENSTGFIQAQASSGDILIRSSKGAGNLNTSSGNIVFELTEVTDSIDLEASSGDVTLKIPETTAFEFEVGTSSGDIETFFDDQLSYDEDGEHATGTIGVNAEKTIRINTTSGNIEVVR